MPPTSFDGSMAEFVRVKDMTNHLVVIAIDHVACVTIETSGKVMIYLSNGKQVMAAPDECTQLFEKIGVGPQDFPA
jgi:hypothetical protein